MIEGIIAGIVLAAFWLAIWAFVFVITAPLYAAMSDEEFDRAMINLHLSINDPYYRIFL